MSYPRDLDEIPEQELLAEISRRATARAGRRCDYCGLPPELPVCRFPERHAAAAESCPVESAPTEEVLRSAVGGHTPAPPAPPAEIPEA